MLFHSISVSDVRPGDHLYRWRNLKLLEGIAVERNGTGSPMFVIVLSDPKFFYMVSLDRFKGHGTLRRVLYDQGGNVVNWIKLSGTSYVEKRRPTEEIVQNAHLLLDVNNRNLALMENLFVKGFNSFAKLCSTMSHARWRHILLDDDDNLSLTNNSQPISQSMQITPVNDIFLSSDKTECSICMERSCDVAFQCGHLTCSKCAEALIYCHICRRKINKKIKLYWS